jgi:hypothetical protein
MRLGIKLPLIVAAAAVLGSSLHGQGRSPFLPPETEAAGPTVTEDAPLQFCGIVGEGENARYCVYDPSRRRSLWLKQGEESGAVQLQNYDPDNRTLSVVQNGRPMVLKLQTAKLGPPVAGGPGGPLPVAGAPQPGASPLVNTVVTNPTPADEAKRLEAVAAEVRRRRALRQAAAQAQGQTVDGQQPPQGVPR